METESRINDPSQSQRQRSKNDQNYESEDESSQKQIIRMKHLKESQTNYLDELKKSNKKKGRSRANDDPQQKMKELIEQAEKLASFLISKHKMGFSDVKSKGKESTRRNRKRQGESEDENLIE